MNVGAGNALTLDLRHVAGDTLASGAAVFMMRVRFQRGFMRSVWKIRTMTVHADLVRGLDELRVVSRSMHIMAIEACDVVPVHHALHEIVALHAVLVRRAVREIVKIGLPQRAVFEPPEVL